MSTSSENLEIPTVPYFLVLLVPGSNYQAGPEYFAAHVEFIETMTAANVVLLGGDFGTAIEGAEAAYLLRVASEADAAAWAAKDPLVENAVYQPKIVSWKLVGISLGAIDPRLRVDEQR